MQDVKTGPSMKPVSWNKYLFPAIILIALIGLGLYINNIMRVFQAASLPGEKVSPSQITETDLEGQFGLRVNLVAVTAASGMVDVRLKILDGDKARLLLEDRNNFPALRIGENFVLHTSEAIASQEIEFEDDNSIFILFPNAGSAVKPGTPVTILFGDIALEPIVAK